MIEHNCMEWLKHRDVGGVSTEGEPYFEDWWECVVCHEKFTAEEGAEMSTWERVFWKWVRKGADRSYAAWMAEQAERRKK